MASYFLRRFLLIIPTFLGITMAVFVIMHFVPGGPVERQIIRSRMIWRSTGPPGTKCIITKTAIVMPRNVGMISRKRRRKYEAMAGDHLLRRRPAKGMSLAVLLPVPLAN